MADTSPPNKRSPTVTYDAATVASPTASGSAYRTTHSPLRSRKPGPQSPAAGTSSPRASESPAPPRSGPRRRSSMISLASELSVESFRSSTDDLFLPRAARRGQGGAGRGDENHEEHVSSHLHSLPLVLAIVPAIMGVFFQNGATVMTDLTLLGMAAIFLNWSIRIPWDWYHSAQAVRHSDSINTEDFLPDVYETDTIAEEDEDGEPEGEAAGDGAADPPGEQAAQPNSPNETDSPDAEPKPAAAAATSSQQPQRPKPSEAQLAAASSLRIHEILALIACFLSPLAGAGLLHGIREQLSRPSEGLVSNYNLTIFLLAAEIRPLSHLIKLVQHRTLHLQRVVATAPPTQYPAGGTVPASNDALAALAARLSALETQGTNGILSPRSPGGPDQGIGKDSPSAPGSSAPTPPSKEQLVSDVRRSLQPDIDALNRAVRRYEKRATLLSLQIDGRLGALESRVADSIALAAAAERNSSGGGGSGSKKGAGKRGGAATLIDWAAGVAVMPIKAAAWAAGRLLQLPVRVAGWFVGLAREVLALVKEAATGGAAAAAAAAAADGKAGRRRRVDGDMSRVKAKSRDNKERDRDGGVAVSASGAKVRAKRLV